MNEQFPAIPDPTDFDREMQRSKCYLPTPEQIAAACEKIQREWNDVERARRRGIRKGDDDAWHLPTVGDPEMSDD